MKKLMYAGLIAVLSLLLAGCGQNGGNGGGQTTEVQTTAEPESQVKVDLSEIHEAVKAVYGEAYIPSMEMDSQYISDLFGVTEDLYDEVIAEGPMISVHVDIFAAFHAKEGQGQKIEDSLNAYQKDLRENSMQYPMNMPKVEASQVVRHGDYVFFVMLGEVDPDAADEEAMLKGAKESNQLAVDAINGFFNS